MFHVPEKYRLTRSSIFPFTGTGNNGRFLIPCDDPKFVIFAIASDGEGWEHVSVHVEHKTMRRERTPTWDEMCFIKNIFWDADDVVIQFHPRSVDYVNDHKHTLHLWRPTTVEFPTPPIILV